MFQGSPYFSVTGFHDNYRSMQSALDRGHALIGMVIPWNFADSLQAGRRVAIQIIADGSDANSARLALGYARSLGMIYSRTITARRMQLRGLGSPPPPVQMVPRACYNPDLRSQNSIIPGIIAIVMIVIAAMLTSITVAREWELGSMEQLISTPVRPAELVFGKVIPYFAVGMLDVGIAVALGRWMFGVPLRGSPGLLFAVAAVFLTGALFFGMMLSVTLKSQTLANQAAMIGSYLPTLLLSGFVFAIENMPQPIQWLTFIVPGRYFIELLRGIYLKGIGLEVLWLNMVLLSLYAGVMMVLALKKMKLHLE